MNDAIRILSGNGNLELSQKICDYLGLSLSPCLITKFKNGEMRVEIDKKVNVRGRECFIIDPCCEPVNDNLMGLLFLSDALRRASATEITAVLTQYPYAREDKKKKSGVPIAARAVADLFGAVGTKRIITLDLHSAQIQGFSNNPIDNLYASHVFLPYLRNRFGGNLVVMSPDIGGEKRVEAYGEKLGVDFGLFFKNRDKDKPGEIRQMLSPQLLRGESFAGKDVVIFDDMIDTGGTMATAAKIILSHPYNAKRVHAMATHGIFSDNAIGRLQKSGISSVVVTDTIPKPENCSDEFVKYLTVAPLLGEAIKRVHNKDKLSGLFELEI